MSKLLLMHVGSKSPDPHTTALPTNQKINTVHPQSHYAQTLKQIDLKLSDAQRQLSAFRVKCPSHIS